MTATPALTTDLKREVLILEEDLRARLESITETDKQVQTPKDLWLEAHHDALTRGRTSASWVAWRDDRITQAAVGWVLTTVFVRFCEDNALVTPVWITGPGPRRQEALDAELAFYRERSATGEDVTTREWLQQSVGHLASLPSTAALVDTHAALHLLSPSGDAAEKLVAFWRQRDGAGALRHDLTDPTLSTRFLGDLYQDLSDHAKATYALLQTPVFVEEFILDRTLEPALDERPLEGFRMIDPTCGSGHFLLGAFERLLDRWQREAPGLEKQALVQEALDAVHGVDLNPFAVAITRFRLTVAAIRACRATSLEDTPAFQFHVQTGDSLLHGTLQMKFDLNLGNGLDDDVEDGVGGFTYATEDLAALRGILREGYYDAVVGNPPYITVKDKTLNQEYRTRYQTCKGTYALTVPFMERFFALAKRGEGAQLAGWVGQITSNSFMKREFGSKLTEEFLALKDLRLVADTSGAFIPGHGTPTVILVGRNQRAVGQTVRAVLGVRGEPGRPVDPAKGVVWCSIVEHVDQPGWDDGWVTVANLNRSRLAGHPWSLTGGGADELLARLEGGNPDHLSTTATEIGFGAVTREDSAYMIGTGPLRRAGVAPAHQLPIVEGDVTRDWSIDTPTMSLWPYSPETLQAEIDFGTHRLLWPFKAALSDRVAYGNTQLERGLGWFEYSMFFGKRFARPLSIAFAFVATHNHFVLDRGGKVFKQSAPVIKLPAEATEDEHLELLGLLNSSTACFWLKQK